MIISTLWAKGPEYDGVRFTSNRTLTNVIRKFFSQDLRSNFAKVQRLAGKTTLLVCFKLIQWNLTHFFTFQVLIFNKYVRTSVLEVPAPNAAAIDYLVFNSLDNDAI